MELNDLEMQIDFINFTRMKYEWKQRWSYLPDITIIINITTTTPITATTLFGVCLRVEGFFIFQIYILSILFHFSTFEMFPVVWFIFFYFYIFCGKQ